MLFDWRLRQEIKTVNSFASARYLFIGLNEAKHFSKADRLIFNKCLDNLQTISEMTRLSEDVALFRNENDREKMEKYLNQISARIKDFSTQDVTSFEEAVYLLQETPDSYSEVRFDSFLEDNCFDGRLYQMALTYTREKMLKADIYRSSLKEFVNIIYTFNNTNKKRAKNATITTALVCLLNHVSSFQQMLEIIEIISVSNTNFSEEIDELLIHKCLDINNDIGIYSIESLIKIHTIIPIKSNLRCEITAIIDKLCHEIITEPVSYDRLYYLKKHLPIECVSRKEIKNLILQYESVAN